MNSLKNKRKDIGITQEQAAQACGVSRRTYQFYEESNVKNEKYNELYEALKAMGVFDFTNVVLSRKTIKRICELVFSKYRGIRCAYLYGDYARMEKVVKASSPVDIFIVGKNVDTKKIAKELKAKLYKEINLTMLDDVVGRLDFENIVVEAIKIYKSKRENNPLNSLQ